LDVGGFALSQIGGLVDLALCYGPGFTAICAEIVEAVWRRDPKTLESASGFFDLPLHLEGSESVVRAGLAILEGTELYKLREYLKVVAFNSRKALGALASLTENIAELDVYPTFLELKDKDSDYVSRGIREVPFNDWVITESDGAILSTLPAKVKVNYASLDECHRSIVDRYPDSFEVHGNPYTGMVYRITTAAFPDSPACACETVIAPEPIIAIPFSPYGSDCPSIAELMAFLWFSDRPCECWADVETFVLSRSNEPCLVASFFAYAHRHRCPILADKWSHHLSHFSVDFYSLLALCCYFGQLDDVVLSDSQRSLLVSTLARFGLRDIDGTSLINAVIAESGLRKRLLFLVLKFHREQLPEWFFSAPSELSVQLNEFLEWPRPEAAVAALSNTLFACDWLSSVTPLGEPTPPSAPILLPDDFVDAIVEVPDTSPLAPFFHFLMNDAVLTETQYSRFTASVIRGHSLYFYSTELNTAPPSSTQLFFSLLSQSPPPTPFSSYLKWKPPSYSRQFARFSQQTQLPHGSIPSDIHPIYPALLQDSLLRAYPEFAQAAFPGVSNGLSVSGSFDSTKSTLHMSIERILRLPDAEICSIFKSPSFAEGLLEFLGAFLMSLSESPRCLADTICVVKTIIGRVPLDLLVRVVMNKDFLNSEDFVVVYIVVRLYLKLVGKAIEPEMIEIMLQTKVSGEKRRRLLQPLDVPGIRQLLFGTPT
jgi:hypothetical protein